MGRGLVNTSINRRLLVVSNRCSEVADLLEKYSSPAEMATYDPVLSDGQC